MSAPPAVISPGGTAVIPTKTGGAVLISPASVGGRRRRGSKKMTKKVRAMLKKMKLMGGDLVPMQIEGSENDMDESDGGRRRRRRTRRSRRRSRAGLFA